MIDLMIVDKYKVWSLQLKTKLEREQLWDIVERTDEPSKAKNDEAWSSKNAKALTVIKCYSKNEFYDAIRNTSSAKIAWDTLAAICGPLKTAFEFLADDGNNYLDWSLKVKAILRNRQLWHIVEGTDDPPNVEKNDMALGLIEYSCFWFRAGLKEALGLDDTLYRMTSAKIVWDALAAICAVPKNILTDKKSIVAIIERLESIPDVIKRLDHVDNYEVWSDQVKTYLTNKQRLWNIVEGTKAENDEAAFEAWSEKNAMALAVIVFSCGYRLRCAIWGITLAKVAWDTLAEKCKFPKSRYIDLMNVDKYEEWSHQVKIELRDKQLWDIVEGTDEPPKEESDDPAFMAWSHKNAEALKVIKRSSKNQFYDAIRRISSAKIAWDTLEAICELSETAFEFLADDGNNYLDWSLKVKAILMDRGLWDIVEGTDDPPNAKENGMALGLIEYSCFPFRTRLNVTLDLDDKLESITSAKIVWDALAAICALPKNILTDKKSIATFIERLESIPDVIKHLDDVDNYEDWSDEVKTYLMDEQLWDIVKGTNEPPKAENDEATLKAWSGKNAMALGVIMFSCGYRLRFAIWWITSAKIVWDTLAEVCEFRKSDYIVRGEYDYVAWSLRMEDYLKQQKLWDIVEATTEPPKPRDGENTFNAWSKKNAKALYLIWESSVAVYSFKKSTRTAQIAWDTLAEFEYPGGIKKSELRKYKLFRQDLRKGTWRAANEFITSCPEAKSAIIANTGSTALHIAILAGHLNIVKGLVNVLPIDKLKIKDKDGNTVLGYCALVGNTEMAKCIVDKCPSLVGIGNGSYGLIPVVMALTHDSNTNAIARFLFSATDLQYLSPGKSVNGATFVTRCIYCQAFDLALLALEKFPNLVTALDIENESPVLALARISFAYTSGNQRWIYNSQGFVWNLLKFPEINLINGLKLLHDKFIKALLHHMCEVLVGLNFQQLENGKVIEAIVIAIKQGRVKFVTEILKAFPELAWHVEKSTGRNLFMFAVLHRQDEVFRFLCKSPAKYSILAEVDFDSNSILHIAAMLEPSARPIKTPGAALLMQREVQWFKAVERIVHPSTLERTNKNDQTPGQLLIESHKELMKEGEKWMKEIANSCIAVDTLIVTIMFAAAITIPGGNKQESGLPMFLNVKVFMLFIISDALSLLFASISLLMFLGFTSTSYEAEDFLHSLPKKMMIGISTLIISIATMMITFCASLFIILKGKSSVIIPVICLASVPVALFAWIQLRLLIDMIILTYGSSILDRKAKYGA